MIIHELPMKQFDAVISTNSNQVSSLDDVAARFDIR